MNLISRIGQHFQDSAQTKLDASAMLAPCIAEAVEAHFTHGDGHHETEDDPEQYRDIAEKALGYGFSGLDRK